MNLRKQALMARLGARMYRKDDEAEDGGRDSTSGVVGTGNAARLAMMDAINNQNDQDRADEFMGTDDGETVVPFVPTDGDGNPLLPVEVDEPTLSADEIAAAEADRVAAAAPAAPAPPPPAPPPTRIKVNGQEIDLTPELIAKAQKIASADQYLEDARRPPAAPVPPPAPATPSVDVEARLAERRALVRAIQMGTEEEALEAIDKLTPQADIPAGLNERQVAAITDQRISFNTAIATFNRDFKDLVDDPQLYQIVLTEDDKLVRAGDERSYSERYTAIGTQVRAWRDSMVQKYAPAPVAAAPAVEDPLKAKVTKKAAAPSAPVSANSRATATTTDDEPDEDTSTVIANMAKARGGPQWTRA